jgi:holo-[acyl-carrier protein] synthase
MVAVGAAEGAVVHVVDLARKEARLRELRHVGRPDVEMRPAGRAAPEEPLAACAEGLAQFLSDFVAADADPGAQGGHEITDPGAPADERFDAPARYPGRRAPPAGMHRGCGAAHRVHQEDRETVRRLHADEKPMAGGDPHVTFGALLPRRLADGGAMNLPQQEQMTAIGQRTRHTPTAARSRFPTRRTEPFLEAVDEAWDLLQRCYGHHPQRLTHGAMIHCYTPLVQREHRIVASAREVVAIEEVGRLVASSSVFTPAEQAYAESKSDPDRRLAARLAAKRAALLLLGEGMDERDVEVLPARGGPPRLSLSPRALARLRVLGAARARVSLTHGRTHAAAAVLFLGAE